jgi:hypothetical protein
MGVMVSKGLEQFAQPLTALLLVFFVYVPLD